MEKGIKFHNIYYRCPIFILMYGLTVFYVITYYKAGNNNVDLDLGILEMSLSPYQYTYMGFAILIVIGILMHFSTIKV